MRNQKRTIEPTTQSAVMAAMAAARAAVAGSGLDFGGFKIGNFVVE
jgi:hypothetical protein